MTQPTKKPASRDKWLHLKVSDAEREQLKLFAAEKKITVADFVRQSIDQKTSGVRPRQIRESRKADPSLLAALGKIGGNLNQMGRWANTYKSGADVVEVLAVLSSIDQSIKKLFTLDQNDKNEGGDDASTTF